MQGDTTKTKGREQILGGHQIAAARHLGHGFTVEQDVKAVAPQLTLEHRGATKDVLFAVALLVPLADAIAGCGRGHEIEPIEAGMRRLRGHHLHKVAVLQRSSKRAKAIINTNSLAAITHLGVNAIGKINSRRALAQAHYITFGGEHEHLLIEEVFLDRTQKVIAVVANTILLPIHQLTQPVEALSIRPESRRRTALFVFPMRGDAEFSHAVHFRGADLHLDRPMPTDHRCMQ